MWVPVVFLFRLEKLPEPESALGAFFMNTHYNDYIRGTTWKKKREEFLSSDLYDELCFCCRFKNKYIQIHHISYDNFKNELLTDLCAVCLSCHLKIHKLNRVGGLALNECHAMLMEYFKYTDKNNLENLESVPSSDFIELNKKNKSFRAIKEILLTGERDHVCDSNGINILILTDGQRLPESRKSRRKNRKQITDIAITCSKCGHENELYQSLSDFYKRNA